jgi:soluble lytic murein transglycosylase-like protein
MIRLAAALVLLLMSAAPARADLVFFQSGRALSVKSHHLEGETMVLELRGGGEMECDRALIVEIRADEVPYPEPVVAAATPEPVLASGPSPLLKSHAQYEPIIKRLSEANGVDAILVRAVIQVESDYQEKARSAKGARGLMQLMPDTARQYGLRNPYDPTGNIEAGVKHLKSLLERFPLALALAAYNAGAAAVEKFGGVPPYPETQAYVSRILALVGS